MGVHNFWDLVTPVGRPIKVETLRNKRLAIDASIWIYQFMIALKGQANPHIIGFFKRICKLLYFGIKPIFIFDGKAPELKRETIKKRKLKSKSNNGEEEDIKSIARRILAKKLQLHADITNNNVNNKKKRKLDVSRKEHQGVDGLFDTYYEDIYDEESATEQEGDNNVKRNRDNNESVLFKKQDDYDLPDVEVSLNPRDERFQMDNEYDKLTKEVAIELEDVDLETIDPQSKAFAKLPLSTQYIILSHLRLKSRLRMGYTKVQLEELFPNPMEFSKFQISRVQKRNYLTQKLMNVSGMDNDDISAKRLAGDKNRMYQLQRVDNGYSLTLNQKGTDLERQVRNEFDDNVNEDDDDIDWNEHIDTAIEVKKDQKLNEDGLFIKEDISDEEDNLVNDSNDNEYDDDDDDDEFDDVDFEDVENTKDNLQEEIKSIYEYAKKNNKQKENKKHHDEGREHAVDKDLEEQIEWLQQIELQKAIEESKKDLINMLNKENKISNIDDGKNIKEPPIILSKSTLSKTLFKNFDFSKNTLFKKSDNKDNVKKDIEQKIVEMDDEENDYVTAAHNEEKLKKEEEEEEEDKPKPLPLPDWFQSSTLDGWKTVDKKVDSEEDEDRDDEETESKIGDSLSLDIGDNFRAVEIGSFVTKDMGEGKIEGMKNQTTETPSDNISKVEFKDEPSETNEPNEHRDDLVEVSKLKDVQTKKDEIKSEEAAELGDKKKKSVESKDQSIALNEMKHSDEISESFREPIEVIELEEEPIERAEQEDESEKHLKAFQEKTSKLNTSIIGSEKTEKRRIEEDNDDDDDSFSDDNEYNESYFINADIEFPEIQQKAINNNFSSDDITQEMLNDIFNLLKIMGIPYLTSPEEAEAQCAELEILNLCDGIITDDSDCFLFGGKVIYKNMFMNKQFTEVYFSREIERMVGINRDRMIDLAILLGSDYTLGVKGIGKVMAMEILGEFGSLTKFSKWWTNYQNGIIEEDNLVRKKIRNKLKKDFFINNKDDFPPIGIVNAYLSPNVDKSKEEFQWGQINEALMVKFLKESLNWEEEHTLSIIKPVIENMNRPNQRSIDDYLNIEMGTKINISKRLKTAIDKLKKVNDKK